MKVNFSRLEIARASGLYTLFPPLYYYCIGFRQTQRPGSGSLLRRPQKRNEGFLREGSEEAAAATIGRGEQNKYHKSTSFTP